MDILLINYNNPIGWSLKRELLNINVVNNLFTISTEDNFIELHQSIKQDKAIIIYFFEEQKEIERWLWQTIRIKTKSLNPIIVLGFIDKEIFLKLNRAFNIFPCQYQYLNIFESQPLLIKNIITLKSVPAADLTIHISECGSIKGQIAGYAHDIRGELLRNKFQNSKKCILLIKNIIELKSYVDDVEVNYDNIIKIINLLKEKKELNKIISFIMTLENNFRKN